MKLTKPLNSMIIFELKTLFGPQFPRADIFCDQDILILTNLNNKRMIAVMDRFRHMTCRYTVSLVGVEYYLLGPNNQGIQMFYLL